MKIKTIYHLNDACDVTIIEEKWYFFKWCIYTFFREK